GDFDETNDTVNTHLGCPGVGPSQCPQLYEYAEPITHVTAGSLPIFVAHSTGDVHIKAGTDEVFIAAYRAAGARSTFYEPSGNLHGVDFFQDATAKSQTLAFLTS